MKRMSIAVENILKPIESATGMASGFYKEPDYINNERDLILAKGWAALELKSELPKVGWIKPIEFLGLPLLVTHQHKDKYRVFHNVCRHRGMILVQQEQQITKVIRCPYHSWTYGMDGRLMGTPHIGGYGIHKSENLDKSIYGLMEVPSGMFMNVLMINLDGKAGTLEDHLKPLTNRWHKFLGDDGYKLMNLAQDNNKIIFDVNCNWKLAIENFAEAYHLPSLHPELNSVSPLNVHYNIDINENFSGQGTTAYSDDKESKNLPKFPAWPKDKLNFGEYMCVYPNLLTGIQNNHAFVILLTPVHGERTIEKVEIFYLGDSATDEKYRAARAAAAESWKTVFAEDIIAVEGMQKGRSSPYYDGGVYAVPLEHPTYHFHQWVANKLKSDICDI